MLKLIAFLFCLPLLAQQIQTPPPLQTVNYYSGSNLIYVCQALSTQPKAASFIATAATNASPAVLTSSGHGLDYESVATASPTIMITGGTGAWAAINGVWKATVTSANAFSIPVDSTTFSTLAGTIVVTTLSPRTVDTVWMIKKYVYDSSNNLLWNGWAASAQGAGSTFLDGASPSFNKACASRTTYSYQ